VGKPVGHVKGDSQHEVMGLILFNPTGMGVALMAGGWGDAKFYSEFYS